jgi:hypothetical protein
LKTHNKQIIISFLCEYTTMRVQFSFSKDYDVVLTASFKDSQLISNVNRLINNIF